MRGSRAALVARPFRRFAAFGLPAIAIVATAVALVRPLRAATELPDRLTDQEFWGLIDQFSEPNGYFQSDNLVGNERPLQYVVPALRKMKRGGAYLGVAPDQNFTYIVALEPRIAFILDIRRGNLHEHLMYKALVELSADRADFVSRLFSKKRPAGLGADSTAQQIMEAFWNVQTDDDLYKENLRAIEDQLSKKHGWVLSPDDLRGIEYVYWAFYWFGPTITYRSSTGGGTGYGGTMPTYADMAAATDAGGEAHGYLATEANFRALKRLEERNLIVPIVGDFAGPKALRAIGKYLSDHDSKVSAFYTSNVEQYLFQNSVWQGFYQNVATLPIDDATVFIRSARSMNVLDPIGAFLKDLNAGTIRTYTDVTSRGIR